MLIESFFFMDCDRYPMPDRKVLWLAFTIHNCPAASSPLAQRLVVLIEPAERAQEVTALGAGAGQERGVQVCLKELPANVAALRIAVDQAHGGLDVGGSRSDNQPRRKSRAPH